ncbi:helix-turn-helix domain-containing protein [Pontibacillus marinus]|uniref:AraC family transcriptional regulator n=1 Tax=Pontibacillus marinus BH030004 = DSM 16465 TaxID=1385511 RepID=A0A0A5GKJ1_9BACI|nr:helix-turn-helix domain-containing protein [Pontibacillus marinus]KGX91748.1 AraC family transcriptional regulator [Pontibacillus marinus BH030004 = DSM 16465]
MKLLIADRDNNERVGINWMIQAYSIPIEETILVDSYDELITNIENKQPEIICVELDMISKDGWNDFKRCVDSYVKFIILTTTESTFARAMQAIEVKAEELLVKPNTPDTIKHAVDHCVQKVQRQPYATNSVSLQQETEISYHALFLNDEKIGEEYHLLLLQTESPNRLKDLRYFLKQYHIQHPWFQFPVTDVIAVVMNTSIEQMIQDAQHLLKAWEAQYDEPLVIVHDCDEKETQSIYRKYQDARNAVGLTFYTGYRQIIPSNLEEQWQVIDPFLSSAEQREWVDMLSEGDKEQLKNWMYREFLQMDQPYPDPGLVRTRLTSILAQIRRFMKNHYLDTGSYETSYHRVFETILYNPVLYRIVQELLLFVYDVIDGVAKQQERSRLDITEQALRYIEENFHLTDLDLNMVALSVDRSPAYMSHLLGKKHGKSFRELLRDIRVKEAKRLLLQTDFPIQSIAEKSGFHNANYFSRIFKDHTGVSPRLFRQQMN